jgi:hypothetical protein
MTIESQIADQINQAIPDVKAGSLCVYGDFVGRPYDNIFRVCSARTSPNGDALIVEFDEGGTLEVWAPNSASITRTVFAIATASRVRWQWFSYGLPQIPENLYSIDHVRTADVVAVTHTRGVSRRYVVHAASRHAVEILDGWEHLPNGDPFRSRPE